MAAPTPTARVAPNGTKLKDGYKSVITFARLSNFAIFEKSMTPPGYDGGDPIEQTTMHNDDVHTKAPQSLIDCTNSTIKCAYDPKCYKDSGGALSLINIEDTITQRFSDGSTLAYYGYLKSWTPDEMSMGEQPEATVEIVVTNFDPVNKVEALPVLTEVTGT